MSTLGTRSASSASSRRSSRGRGRSSRPRRPAALHRRCLPEVVWVASRTRPPAPPRRKRQQKPAMASPPRPALAVSPRNNRPPDSAGGGLADHQHGGHPLTAPSCQSDGLHEKPVAPALAIVPRPGPRGLIGSNGSTPYSTRTAIAIMPNSRPRTHRPRSRHACPPCTDGRDDAQHRGQDEQHQWNRSLSEVSAYGDDEMTCTATSPPARWRSVAGVQRDVEHDGAQQGRDHQLADTMVWDGNSGR